MTQLNKRARSVLYSVVTEFTATGEPVGSRTLTKKYAFDLSPATIRNVLADLEEGGYLVQPHTSAGRIPTAAAFRVFIDALMRIRRLSDNEVGQIEELLDEVAPGTDIFRESGRLLSELTGAVGVVARPRVETRAVSKVRFVTTRPQEVLVVVVFSDGTVENRFITVDRVPTEREVEKLHEILGHVIDGHTLVGLRDDLAARAAEARAELRSLLHAGQGMLSAAIEGTSGAMDVIIEGQARVLERPEFADGERVRELLGVLDDRDQLVGLLERAVISERVQVFLGDEATGVAGRQVSVVAAPYRDRDRVGGLGVVGPQRMDYPGVVPLVGAMANAVGQALSRERGSGTGGSGPSE